MDKSYIDSQLKKFNVSDAAISELRLKYSSLTIGGINDIEGYKAVREARISVKSYISEVEKKRKELIAGHLVFQRAVNDEAKRITCLLKDIKDPLEEQEEAYEKEKERLKREKEQKEAEILKIRVKALIDLGCNFDGINYIAKYADVVIPMIELKSLSDDQFNNHVIPFLKEKFEEVKKRQEQEEIARREAREKAEADLRAERARLEQQRREQEAEMQRLKEIERKQKAEEARILEEKNRVAEEARIAAIAKKQAEIVEKSEEVVKIAHEEVIKQDEEKKDATQTVFVLIERDTRFNFIAGIHGVFISEKEAIKKIDSLENKENYDILPFKLI